ncbi:MAG: hypothetical protein JKY92_09340 [Magnetovibrio sp.]|nr:hypothetical protein [Magnetovibrio sp.]
MNNALWHRLLVSGIAFAPAGLGTGDGGGEFAVPDGFPDTMRGGTAEETLANVFGEFQQSETRATGLRDKLAQAPSAPKEAAGYNFEAGEKVASYFDGDGKTVNMLRDVAHKLGMPDAMFAPFVNGVAEKMLDGGQLLEPYDGAGEIKAYRDGYGLDDAVASTELENNQAFAEGIFGQLQGIPENLELPAKAAMMTLGDTAGGNALLKALSGRLSDSGIRVSGEANISGALSKEDLTKLDTDPRIDPTNENHPDMKQRYDPALRKQYDEAYARLS